MRGIIVSAILASSLSGCMTARPVVHEPVEVIHNVYVRVPAALTQKCPVAMPRNNSGRELLRVARDRRACVEKLNAQLEAIGKIEGALVPEGAKP